MREYFNRKVEQNINWKRNRFQKINDFKYRQKRHTTVNGQRCWPNVHSKKKFPVIKLSIFFTFQRSTQDELGPMLATHNHYHEYLRMTTTMKTTTYIYWMRLQSISWVPVFWVNNILYKIPFINYVNVCSSSLSLCYSFGHSAWKFISEMLKHRCCRHLVSPKKAISKVITA